MQDAVDRPQEGGPSLIVEDNDNTGGRQRRTAAKLPLHTPERRESRQTTETKTKESGKVRGGSDKMAVTAVPRITEHCLQIFKVCPLTLK